jgi:hypothetical protein
MRKFTTTVHYRTQSGRRYLKVFDDVTAASVADAKAYARVKFNADRSVGKNANNYAQAKAKVTRVTATEITAKRVEPATPPPARSQVGLSGTITIDGSERLLVTIIAEFSKLGGQQRVVVEDERGVMFILTPDELGL